MSNKEPLVTENGTITTDQPLFICSWNGGDQVEIHTRQTLLDNYKQTNLFDTEEDGWIGINFPTLLEELINGNIWTTCRNDNMSIKRIK